MQKFIISLLGMLLSLPLSAQLSLDRQVVAAAGIDSEANGLALNQTLGEASNGPLSGGSFYLSAGFQQGDLLVPSSLDDGLLAHFSTYPNPVLSELTLDLQTKKPTTLHLSLRDLHGRTLWTQAVPLSPGIPQQLRLDVSDFPAGAYLLSGQRENGQLVLRQAVIKQ
jgi:hypothetical protein